MKIISTLICFAFGLAVSSQTIEKISPAGRILLNDYLLKMQVDKEAGIIDRPNHMESTPIISALVILTDEKFAEEIETLGFEISADLGNILVVRLPIDQVEYLASFKWVKSISFGEKASPDLDYARPSGNVQSVQSGFSYNGTTVSFDGSGVVCGMMDTGLEANHINFKNEDGTSRIKRLWYMNSNNGTSVEYTDQTISGFTTDKTTEGHATHVAGIIGGGYKGNGNFLKLTTASGNTGSQQTNQPIPYYGVATGADLAFAVGELYTPNIVQGVSNIVEYANSLGKPVVVNLSLGHTSGPHDGTDAYSQALSKLGEKAIICMSAGNDGNANISLSQIFTSRLTTLKTTIANNTADGIADLWSSDDKPFNVSWGIYNTTDMSFTELIKITAAGQSGTTKGNTAFTTYFNGTLTVQSTIDPNNNRFEVYSELSSISPKSNIGNRFLAIEIQGSAGQTAYLYGGTKVTFAKNNLAGYSDGNAKNSINDAACAANIISVGAYTSRTTWGQLNGAVYTYTSGYTVGAIAPFSSYGTSFQGKKLPLICAPGANIISSYSSYYAGSSASTTMCASAYSNDATYYWGPMQGTSMSCPYVTGTIGLWLQADPSLDFNKVMDVIDNTSITDSNMRSNAERWGAGKIDALEGVKYVLANKAAIGTVWADEAQRLVITASAEGYDVFVADGRDITVTLYDLQGRPAARVQGSDGAATLSADGLPHGVYIIEARGDGYRFSRKVTR